MMMIQTCAHSIHNNIHTFLLRLAQPSFHTIPTQIAHRAYALGGGASFRSLSRSFFPKPSIDAVRLSFLDPRFQVFAPEPLVLVLLCGTTGVSPTPPPPELPKLSALAYGSVPA